MFQISLSGCKDNQTSADTYASGGAVGAMSHVSPCTTTYTRRILNAYVSDTGLYDFFATDSESDLPGTASFC